MVHNNGWMLLKNVPFVALLIILNIFSIGCAFDLANIKPAPAEITPCTTNCRSFTLSEDVLLDNISCGYKRTIKQGSKWVCTGHIPEGPVYKPVNTCFTIECSNVFEAYLVLREKTVIGFYLPVENGFVPIKKPVELLIQ
jgi:hypothetical protein